MFELYNKRIVTDLFLCWNVTDTRMLEMMWLGKVHTSQLFLKFVESPPTLPLATPIIDAFWYFHLPSLHHRYGSVYHMARGQCGMLKFG